MAGVSTRKYGRVVGDGGHGEHVAAREPSGRAQGAFLQVSTAFFRIIVLTERPTVWVTNLMYRTFFKLSLAFPVLVLFYYFFIQVIQVWLGVNGPFVFADESAYASMARAILDGDYLISGYRQYGPLYPALLALISLIVKTDFYSAALLINVTCWLLGVLLAYNIFKLLKGTNIECVAGAALVFVSPFWSLSVVTWADPLFYTLFYASIYFLLVELKTNSSLNRNMIGLSIGLLFLAKPIGLFYGIIIYLTLVIYYYKKCLAIRCDRQKIVLMLAQVVFVSCIVIIPWLVRNIYDGAGLLGYGYAPKWLGKMLQDGVLDTLLVLVKSFIYQIAYVGFMSFGMVVIGLIFWGFKISKSSPELDLVMFSLVCTIVMVASISAMHNAPHPALGYWVPNGRYMSHLSPLLIIMAFIYRRENGYILTNRYIIRGIVLWIVMALIVYFASPLRMLAPMALTSIPDLGLMFWWEGASFVWRSEHNPSSEQLITSIFLLIPALALLVLPEYFSGTNKTKTQNYGVALIVVVLVLVMFGGVQQYKRIGIMQATQASLNDLFRNNKFICGKYIYFDKAIADSSGTLDFMYKYWCSSSSPRIETVNDYLSSVSHEGGRKLMVVSRKSIPNEDPRILEFSSPDFLLLKSDK